MAKKSPIALEPLITQEDLQQVAALVSQSRTKADEIRDSIIAQVKESGQSMAFLLPDDKVLVAVFMGKSSKPKLDVVPLTAPAKPPLH